MICDVYRNGELETDRQRKIQMIKDKGEQSMLMQRQQLEGKWLKINGKNDNPKKFILFSAWYLGKQIRMNLLQIHHQDE